jgi:hypothetical protein
MSPTSYQTAPPRSSIIASCERLVKRRREACACTSSALEVFAWRLCGRAVVKVARAALHLGDITLPAWSILCCLANNFLRLFSRESLTRMRRRRRLYPPHTALCRFRVTRRGNDYRTRLIFSAAVLPLVWSCLLGWTGKMSARWNCWVSARSVGRCGKL